MRAEPADDRPPERSLIAGIFVGGRSSRMGRTKALLRTPDGAALSGAPLGATLVERWVALARSIGAEPVLVGRRDDVPALAPVIDDAANDCGPLGGLVALLAHAGASPVLALACDMPFVSASLLTRLASAPDAIAVAARRDGRWEPLFARYRPDALALARARLAKRELALQGFLDALGAEALSLTIDEHAELRDWDRPEDVEAL